VIELIDTSTRDGNQSLWGATGLTRDDIVSIAPAIGRVGYRALDYATSTHMGISVRYHHEDPWEQLRAVSEAMPDVLVNFLTTGMRFISWEPADEDVMAMVFRCVARNGVRRIQIADPMNDPRALAQVARLAKREGVQEVVVGLTYSISPAHDDEHYATRAKAMGECADVDRLYLKDPGGLVTVDRLRELTPLLRAGIGDKPLELHSHCTISLAPLTYMEAARLGYATLHTAVRPLANGTSQPSAESTVANLEAFGFEHGIDVEALEATSAHFAAIAERKGLPVGVPQEYDARYYRHQVPGGVMTTTRRQLAEMRREDLFDGVIDEIEHVRAEFGWPIVVTPYAQFLVTQSVMNLLAVDRGAERYADVPDNVIRYFLGHFGDPPAPWDQDVADRVLSRPQAERLAKVEPLSLEGARERFGPSMSEEEMLLRMTMPAEQVDAIGTPVPEPSPAPPASSSGPREPAAASRNGDASAVVRLLREVAARPSISYLRVERDDELVEWRR
jgi:oxaloacetate decarboxylase alpha subunit